MSGTSALSNTVIEMSCNQVSSLDNGNLSDECVDITNNESDLDCWCDYIAVSNNEREIKDLLDLLNCDDCIDCIESTGYLTFLVQRWLCFIVSSLSLAWCVVTPSIGSILVNIVCSDFNVQ